MSLRISLLGALLVVAACNTESAPEQPEESADAPMQMDSKVGSLVDSVTAARGAIASNVDHYRQQVAALLNEMNTEMRSMNMAADQAWTALTDSLRQDLTALAEAKGEEQRALLSAHDARLKRLIDSHKSMMTH